MSNPELILKTLDGKLDHTVRLVLYGRAAIHLGFDNAPEETGRSQDVDGIVPMADLDALVNDGGFWDAVEATNRELQARSLYITHLFQEDQVFRRPDWLEQLVPLTRPSLKWFRLYRPATIDLILTKMMRGADPQDMADVAFLVRADAITLEALEDAFAGAIIPAIPELEEAFRQAQAAVRKIVTESSAP